MLVEYISGGGGERPPHIVQQSRESAQQLHITYVYTYSSK